MGWLSIPFSLSFWIWVCVVNVRHQTTLPMGFIGFLILFLTLLVLGFILAAIATLSGSRRWVLAALLPISLYAAIAALVWGWSTIDL